MTSPAWLDTLIVEDDALVRQYLGCDLARMIRTALAS
jgi:hypothetical protein